MNNKNIQALDEGLFNFNKNKKTQDPEEKLKEEAKYTLDIDNINESEESRKNRYTKKSLKSYKKYLKHKGESEVNKMVLSLTSEYQPAYVSLQQLDKIGQQRKKAEKAHKKYIRFGTKSGNILVDASTGEIVTKDYKEKLKTLEQKEINKMKDILQYRYGLELKDPDNETINNHFSSLLKEESVIFIDEDLNSSYTRSKNMNTLDIILTEIENNISMKTEVLKEDLAIKAKTVLPEKARETDDQQEIDRINKNRTYIHDNEKLRKTEEDIAKLQNSVQYIKNPKKQELVKKNIENKKIKKVELKNKNSINFRNKVIANNPQQPQLESATIIEALNPAHAGSATSVTNTNNTLDNNRERLDQIKTAADNRKETLDNQIDTLQDAIDRNKEKLTATNSIDDEDTKQNVKTAINKNTAIKDKQIDRLTQQKNEISDNVKDQSKMINKTNKRIIQTNKQINTNECYELDLKNNNPILESEILNEAKYPTVRELAFGGETGKILDVVVNGTSYPSNPEYKIIASKLTKSTVFKNLLFKYKRELDRVNPDRKVLTGIKFKIKTEITKCKKTK